MHLLYITETDEQYKSLQSNSFRLPEIKLLDKLYSDV